MTRMRRIGAGLINENGHRHGGRFPLKNLAPQVGLEPTTLRLHRFPCFRKGVDYLFIFPEKDAGR